MVGPIAERVRELLRQICKEHDIEIVKGHVSQDHIHLFVSVPPHMSISEVVKQLKGKSSWKMMSENKGISKMFWGRHFWARGYFAASSGNVTDEVIMEYIEKQDLSKETDDDFKITAG